MTNQTIPKRSEVPEEMTWNLKDMFASDEAWMTEYEASSFPRISNGLSGLHGLIRVTRS